MTPDRADRLYLGWQYAMPYPEPGPPPRRPTPPEPERLNPDWATALRREENLLNRPLWAAFLVAVVIGVLAVVLAMAGWLDPLVAGLGVVCCALVAAVSGCAIWQGERALRSRLAEERARIGKLRAAQQSRLFAWQAEHASRVRQWQALRAAYLHQKRWYAVCVPDGTHRVDIAGGTLAGWSAMLTTAGAHRLAAGGEVTVLDLSEGPVALDLIAFARTWGIEPLVWAPPGDLSRLDPGAGPGAGPVTDTAAGPAPRSPLRVIAPGQRAGAAEGTVSGTNLAVALTHAPPGTRPGPPWRHTLFVLGADKLTGDALDRLCDAAESTGTGLVLAYRAIPAHVGQRLGRGNAVLALMRLGSAEDAKAGGERLGAGHRFEVCQLTETVGLSVADPAAGPYPGTSGTGGPLAASWSAGDGDPVGGAISGSTAWGLATAKATAKAAGDSESLALALRRSRELLAGPHELEHLPASAMIVSCPGPAGRQVVMADANPGIGGLGAATMLTLEEFRAMPAGAGLPPAAETHPENGTADAPAAPAAPVSWRTGGNRPPPNLGPPPPRLDWRNRPGA